MLNRTSMIVCGLAGGFVFLMTSLGHVEHHGDCKELGEKLRDRIVEAQGIVGTVSGSDTSEANQRAIKEGSSKLAELAVELDGLKLGSDTASAAKQVALVVHSMDEALTALARAISAEQPDQAKKSAEALASANERLQASVLEAERVCE